MGKKNKDRERSEDKKKSKKKSKQQKSKREKSQLKKKKSEKRARSTSSQSSSSGSSSSDRSRDRKQKKKKKTKQTQKEEKKAITMPFQMSQTTTPVIANPLTAIRPGGIGLVIPPPAPLVTTATPSTKPKTKQYHIFKLLPKMPIGCVTLGKTIYSSSFLSEGFQNKMLTSMCEQLQKAAKAQGSKKMASMMSKIKAQINSLEQNSKPENIQMTNESKKFENQFEILQDIYNDEMDKLRGKLIEKIGQ